MFKKLSPVQALISARELAKEVHKDQSYGDKPYEYHLQKVADNLNVVNSRKLINHLRDVTQEGRKYNYLQICLLLKAACWLHDALEDTPLMVSDLWEEGFPSLVIQVVEAMTKNPLESKETYLEGLCTCPWAILVKRADSYSNLTESLSNDRLKGVVKYTDNLKILSEAVLKW